MLYSSGVPQQQLGRRTAPQPRRVSVVVAVAAPAANASSANGRRSQDGGDNGSPEQAQAWTAAAPAAAAADGTAAATHLHHHQQHNQQHNPQHNQHHQQQHNQQQHHNQHSQQQPLPAPGSVAPRYRRIMLKVSGEALAGAAGFGIDPSVLEHAAAEIRAARDHGIQVAVVVGGGNYFRGAAAWPGLERATGDYVGMLATVMNALCLQAALEAQGVTSRVQTAIEMREVAEPYIRRRAIRHLEAGHVVIFGAGTGNPYFTTDTAAALRAAEVQAEVFLKATKVDGVYTHDPVKHPDKAVRYQRLSYRQVVADDELGVMDGTAVTLCKENNIPVVVFNAMQPGNILRAALGEDVGTVVSHGDSSLAAPTRIVIEASSAAELADDA